MDLKWRWSLHFFDTMPHLVVSLAEKVELVSLVHSKWLYFLDKYMLSLKKEKETLVNKLETTM